MNKRPKSGLPYFLTGGVIFAGLFPWSYLATLARRGRPIRRQAVEPLSEPGSSASDPGTLGAHCCVYWDHSRFSLCWRQTRLC